MSETKQITALHVVIDTEQAHDKIGDIDGGYIDKKWLKKHIKSHGTEGMFRQIAYMNFQVFEALREISQDNCDSEELKVNPNI